MMMESHEELLTIADKLSALSEICSAVEVAEPLERLEKAAKTIGRAFSGSWLGYHANVYYEGLEAPPPGAHFSQEWGLKHLYGSGLGSKGNWREMPPEVVKKAVYKLADNPDTEPARKLAEDAAHEFDPFRSDALSILSTELERRADGFLEGLKSEIVNASVPSVSDVINRLRPKGQVMTRDTVTLGPGQQIPPHVAVLAEVHAIQYAFGAVAELGEVTRRAGSHLLRRRRQQTKLALVGTSVFIGHGQSMAWRDLKDFLQDRLKLPWEEFNRVPVAGVTNIERLLQMLDSAAIAFLVMTGEDEQKDGRLHARMNVVHEAGLFQGRLGFSRAIVLLEDGCEEFSNIAGLGQIRFPKGNIMAAFEEIRRVLEREGILSTSK